jgi:hypothetical protein
MKTLVQTRKIADKPRCQVAINIIILLLKRKTGFNKAGCGLFAGSEHTHCSYAIGE